MPTAWGDATAAGAGVLLPFAFAPFGVYPLALLAPALLFLVWRGATPGRAAWRGFLFGLGLFGVGVSWVYVSMYNFGNMPAPLAGFAVLLFVAGLALYFVVFGWAQARLARWSGGWHVILLLPALWVLFEWIRGWFLTGFPWLNLGYSQIDGPLAGYASWVGVYGVGFACILTAGLIAAGTQTPEKFLPRYLPWIVLLWAGGWMAGKVEWVTPVNTPLTVTLVQGNVPLRDKWQPENRVAIMERYLTLSAQAPRSDLIVWPESAIPATLDQIPAAYLVRLQGLSLERGTDFVLGVIERDNRGYYNSVLSLGTSPGIYRKQHLVPFGEYPPFDPLFRWLMQYWNIPMSNFLPGSADQRPLSGAGQNFAVSVCYEDAFGEEVIAFLPQATLLLNVSEDAWFGDSFAPHQRLQMARLRALEAGRPMLRAANTGPSAIIDHRGAVQARSPQFQTHTLTAMVQPMQGSTPYVRYGNYPALILVGLLTVLAGVLSRYRAPPGKLP